MKRTCNLGMDTLVSLMLLLGRFCEKYPLPPTMIWRRRVTRESKGGKGLVNSLNGGVGGGGGLVQLSFIVFSYVYD